METGNAVKSEPTRLLDDKVLAVRNYFSVTHGSFVTLVKRTFDCVCVADKEFSRHVSAGIYAYYNTLHLWARIAGIRQHSGLAIEDEINLLRYLSSEHYPLHEPVNAYLRGIGDFTDPSGSEHKYRLLQLPTRLSYENTSGFFGRVSARTHVYYEALPAPGVAAKRLRYDMEYTRSRGLIPGNWDLPDGLRPLNVAPAAALGGKEAEVRDIALPPDEAGAAEVQPRNMPTANLLGWAPAVQLTQEQMQLLEGCVGRDDEFATSLSRFAYNGPLFVAISGRVRASLAKYKGGASLHEHLQGSIGQCMFIEREPTDTMLFNRTVQYAEGSVRGASAFQLDMRFSDSACVFAYRVRKEPIADKHCWACYDFGQYRHVPPDWIENRNFCFNYGNVKVLNLGRKHTAFTDKNTLRTPLLTAGVVKKSTF